MGRMVMSLVVILLALNLSIGHPQLIRVKRDMFKDILDKGQDAAKGIVNKLTCVPKVMSAGADCIEEFTERKEEDMDAEEVCCIVSDLKDCLKDIVAKECSDGTDLDSIVAHVPGAPSDCGADDGGFKCFVTLHKNLLIIGGIIALAMSAGCCAGILFMRRR
jgi:hypothetical protein